MFVNLDWLSQDASPELGFVFFSANFFIARFAHYIHVPDKRLLAVHAGIDADAGNALCTVRTYIDPFEFFLKAFNRVVGSISLGRLPLSCAIHSRNTLASVLSRSGNTRHCSVHFRKSNLMNKMDSFFCVVVGFLVQTHLTLMILF